MRQLDVRMSAAWGPKLFNELLHYADRWLVLRGGRASGKSYTACQIVLLQAITQTLRVLCCREFQRSIDESVLPVMLTVNETLPPELRFKRKGNGLHGVNGSHIMFQGLSDSTSTTRSIRSLEGVDLAFVEEAQFITDPSFQTLIPTIRKAGSRIMAAYNPRFGTDPVHKLAESGVDGLRVETKHYTDNRMLTDAQLDFIEGYRQLYPATFATEYLGQLVDADDLPRVLQPLDVEAARQAISDLGGCGGHVHAGWDPADAGRDRNALVVRVGPTVVHAEAWEAKRPMTMADSARKVVNVCKAMDVEMLYYDAGGIGAGATALLTETNPPFQHAGIHAGGGVNGPDVQFDQFTLNRNRFQSRSAQLAWTLRMRAANTRRLLNGEDVDAAKCLALGKAVGATPDTADVDRQLLQPLYSEPGGRVRIDKQPKGTDSPDLYDAMALAFAADSANGLTDGLDLWDPEAEWQSSWQTELAAWRARRS